MALSVNATTYTRRLRSKMLPDIMIPKFRVPVSLSLRSWGRTVWVHPCTQGSVLPQREHLREGKKKKSCIFILEKLSLLFFLQWIYSIHLQHHFSTLVSSESFELHAKSNSVQNHSLFMKNEQW